MYDVVGHNNQTHNMEDIHDWAYDVQLDILNCLYSEAIIPNQINIEYVDRLVYIQSLIQEMMHALHNLKAIHMCQICIESSTGLISQHEKRDTELKNLMERLSSERLNIDTALERLLDYATPE